MNVVLTRRFRCSCVTLDGDDEEKRRRMRRKEEMERKGQG
jgi:hypothetical protein